MPLVEIYVIIQVGQVIGAWWTILLLIADSIFGSWLIKREGGKAWQALRMALEEGRMPHRELADGVLILVGGTLMLTPGFVTDIFGHPVHPAVHPARRPPPAGRGDQPHARGVGVPDGAAGVRRPGAPAGPGHNNAPDRIPR